MAATNQWDIGVIYRPDIIFLFAPAGSVPSGMDLYPMITPLSKDFGSISVKMSMRGDECRVKIYPCLVHVLRSQLQKYDAKTMSGVIKQMTAAQHLIKEVTTTEEEECGGFRICPPNRG